jgi:hypothetical protein
MGIKILFEHGSIFNEKTSYGVNVIAINKETNSYCDVVNSFPYLSKLSKKNLDDLFHTLDHMITSVIQGTIDKKGIQFEQPISKYVREKYKEYF